MNKAIIISLLVLILALPAFFIQSCAPIDEVFNSSLDGKNVGVSANDLLASSRFDELVVEVLTVSGFEPKQTTLDSLLTFLGGLVNKPSGIRLVHTEVSSPGLPSYTLNDIKVIESQNRTTKTEGKTISVSLFFADVDYSENTDNQKVLGIAYANTSLVIFEKTIVQLTNEITEPDQGLLERTVTNHEFGHIFGLVNVGTDMQTAHQDEAHGKHCDNEDCLMNWVAETGSFADKLLGMSKIPVFDKNCRDDLKANGSK